MGITYKKLAVHVTVFSLAAFVSLSVLGLWHMDGMTANEEGGMGGCVFIGKAMFCKMTVIEHISLWQRMFTVLPQDTSMFFASLVFSAALVFTAKNILAPPKNYAPAHKLFLTNRQNFSSFNYLKEAFSQGILHPKIFENATF